MAAHYNHLHIQKASDKGEEILESSETIRDALERYATADEPEKEQIPGIRLLGAGRFSFTFLLDDVALKVSSPTSSQDSFEAGRPMWPEDLSVQYDVMTALHEHLRKAGEQEAVGAPEQYFVARTPGNAFVLAQEYMEGWTSVEEKTHEVYDWERPEEEMRREIQGWTDGMRERLTRALGGFGLRESINDIGLHKPNGVHGGNLLVPKQIELNGATPLTIIDQPKIFRGVKNT